MIIPIVGPSALEFWLSGVADSSAHLLAVKKKRVSLPDDYDLSHWKKHYQILSTELGLSFPVHAMANRISDRGSGSFLHACVKSKHLPEQAFIQLNNSIYISSPELCFVQMAEILPFAKLVEIANNLCAIYSIDQQASYGLPEREQIISIADITDFLQRAKGLYGIKKARRAILYATERSRSPVESQMAALAVIPFSQGGFCFPRPEMNLDISLTDHAAMLFKRDSCNCDMVWMDQKVVVEYDSNLSHLTADQHAYDKGKANALHMSGYKTFFATQRNIQSFKDIEEMFRTIREMLGLRPENETLAKYEAIRRETVHTIMYDSWKKYI